MDRYCVWLGHSQQRREIGEEQISVDFQGDRPSDRGAGVAFICILPHHGAVRGNVGGHVNLGAVCQKAKACHVASCHPCHRERFGCRLVRRHLWIDTRQRELGLADFSRSQTLRACSASPGAALPSWLAGFVVLIGARWGGHRAAVPPAEVRRVAASRLGGGCRRGGSLAVARSHRLAHEQRRRGGDEQGVDCVEPAEHRHRSGAGDTEHEL